MNIVQVLEEVSQNQRRRNEAENTVNECQPCREQHGARNVNQTDKPLTLSNPTLFQRKLETEVKEQRRQKNCRALVKPENRPIKRIEFSRVVKHVIDERHQADDVEMQGQGRAIALHQYEEPDQEIEQPDDFEIEALLLDLLGRLSENQLGFKRHAVTFDGVAC